MQLCVAECTYYTAQQQSPVRQQVRCTKQSSFNHIKTLDEGRIKVQASALLGVRRRLGARTTCVQRCLNCWAAHYLRLRGWVPLQLRPCMLGHNKNSCASVRSRGAQRKTLDL